jgi:hypothetical protein
MMNPKFQQLANKMMANPELMQMMQDPAMLQSVRASAPRPSTNRPSIADAAGVTAGPLQAMKSADDIGLTKELGLDKGQGAAAAKEFAAKACSPPFMRRRRAGPRPSAAARAGQRGAQRGRGCLAGDGCSQGGPGRGQGSARGGTLVRHARLASGKRGRGLPHTPAPPAPCPASLPARRRQPGGARPTAWRARRCAPRCVGCPKSRCAPWRRPSARSPRAPACRVGAGRAA